MPRLGLGSSLTGGITPSAVALFSLSLDGTDDYIDLGTNFESTLFNSDFSVSIWIKPIDGRPSSDEYIIGTKDGHDNFWVRIETDGDIQFYYKDGSTESNLIASGYFADGVSNWVYLTVTLSDSAQKIYANGILIASATTSLDTSGFAQDTNRNLVLGARNNAGTIGTFISCYMCNAGVWAAVLTEAQIKSIMNKNYAGLIDSEKTNLVSWWNLSADANDSHGSNNGTLT